MKFYYSLLMAAGMLLFNHRNCFAQDTIPDNECVIDVPNFFTPNGDDIFDTWIINGLECYADFTLSVYDRNGFVAYKHGGDTHLYQPWDGTNNSGRPYPNGVYFYKLELTGGRFLSGSVRVIRTEYN